MEINVDIVKEYFSFLVNEYHFKILEEKIRGNAFYDVQYKDKTKIISISYENIEDFLRVTVFILRNGKLPDYDDVNSTLHLNKINSTLLSLINEDDIKSNNTFFLTYVSENVLQKKLLKSAKELRLCMKYIDKMYIN